jgi:hypothetical protein
MDAVGRYKFESQVKKGRSFLSSLEMVPFLNELPEA